MHNKTENKIKGAKGEDEAVDFLVKKGYKIEDIYYSDYDGSIVKTSLTKLEKDESVHVSGFYRNLNSKRWSN